MQLILFSVNLLKLRNLKYLEVEIKATTAVLKKPPNVLGSCANNMLNTC